ncbi:hypothetical protein CK203_059889 [Vitis vinifera]|uniref:L-type lectin-domain containing receptor kinase IX.1 n=1 Tax=Vitis vinifera TaxID=29760 RepID=A0A438GUB9_VITVI|nr:hypothetical protein CK203_059889 [Vitis vinifera]
MSFPHGELGAWALWLMWSSVGMFLDCFCCPKRRACSCRLLANCLLSMARRHSKLSSSSLADERLRKVWPSLLVTKSAFFPTDDANVEASHPCDPRSCQMDACSQPKLSSGSVVPAKDVRTGCPDTPFDGFVSHGDGRAIITFRAAVRDRVRICRSSRCDMRSSGCDVCEYRVLLPEGFWNCCIGNLLWKKSRGNKGRRKSDQIGGVGLGPLWVGKLLEAADPRLFVDYDDQQMEQLMIVGLWCAHPDCNARPSMREAMVSLILKLYCLFFL